MLYTTVLKSGSQRWKIYQNAVGNAAGTAVSIKSIDEEINRSDGRVEGAASVAGGYGQHYASVVTLDDVIQEDAYIIKIDVEGFEAFVLDGARSLLCGHIVSNLVVEFNRGGQMTKDCDGGWCAG